jgi:hypothetical protein
MFTAYAVVNFTTALTAMSCFLDSFSAVKLFSTSKNLWSQRVDFCVKNMLKFTLYVCVYVCVCNSKHFSGRCTLGPR